MDSPRNNYFSGKSSSASDGVGRGSQETPAEGWGSEGGQGRKLRRGSKEKVTAVAAGT